MKLSRRFVLRGLGGAALTLPVLPSLLTPAEARADAANSKKFFVFFRTGHGGLFASHLFPSLGQSPETRSYGGRTIRRAALAAQVSGGRAVLSPVLQGSSSVLTPALVSKMNVLRGLDIPFYMAHHAAGNLGDYWRTGVDTDNGLTEGTIESTPTVDQLMAWSPSVYASTPRLRSLIFNGGGMSRFYENPAARTGNVVSVSSTASSAWALFQQLFPSGQAPAGPDTPRLLDRVREAYLRLKGDARLSTEDRARLDQHLTRVHELDAQLSAQAPVCEAVAPRDDRHDIDQSGYGSQPTLQAARWKGVMEVTQLALSCGLTKVAVFRVDENFSSYSSSGYHQDIAHRAHLASPAAGSVNAQADEVGSNRAFFEQVVLPFVSGLGSAIDHGHVVWSHESGVQTHSSMSMPVISFGGLDGALRTGSMVDYRNTALQVVNSNPDYQHADVTECPGLLWAQWLGQLLRAMDVPRAEWQQPPGTVAGYPHLTFTRLPNYRRQSGKSLEDYYPTSLFPLASEDLPWLV